MSNNTDNILPLNGASEEAIAQNYRVQPHNIDAEQALLGAIITNNDALDRVVSFLKPEHFFELLHGRIFEITSQLIQSNKRVTPITLKTYFENEDPISEKITVPDYLVRLVSGATTIINAEDYGRTIYDLSQRRALIDIGGEMVNTAYNATINESPDKQIEQVEQKLFSLAESGKYGQGFASFSSSMRIAIEMAAAAHERDGGLSGISTGINDLDEKMGGLQASDLIVLAGRPAMGKTALATNIAFNVANAYTKEEQPDGSVKASNGGVVGFFSLEMSNDQLATRIVSEQAEVSSHKIRRGQIEDDEFKRLVQSAKNLQNLPLFIDHTGGITVAQLAARARKLKRQHGLGLLVIDYIQLLSGSGKSQANRVQEITEITTNLKALAKELNVPIIALSQLSRQVESRDDKRPQLSDLRESGSIEQDADVVLFVYREEYYTQRLQPAEGTQEHFEWQDKMAAVEGVGEVIIGKQRHGSTGFVRLAFVAEYTRFSDLAKPSHVPERYE